MDIQKEKNKLFWSKVSWALQIFFLAAVTALAFLGYLSVFAFLVFLAVLAANSAFLFLMHANIKKGQMLFDLESEKKLEDLAKFDKITRQLVRRDIELARANQRLAELDKAKSDFVSVAAHQLRTPL